MGAPFFRTLRRGAAFFSPKGGLLFRTGVRRGAPACGYGEREGYLFFKKRYPSLKPSQRKFTLRVCSSKSCAACGIGRLRFSVSKRFGLLLSSLSLCLRIGSLHQFPSISDILLYFIIVDRSVSFQQIQVYMQSFSASLVLHTVFCLSADQFVQ